MSLNFDALLDIQPVEHKVGIPDWEGDVPESALKAVATAIGDGPQVVKLTHPDQSIAYKSVLKAAVAALAPGKALNTRDRFTKPAKDANGEDVPDTGGTYLGFSFSVGEPRTRKSRKEG
jgi:hypothetical protein